MQFLIGRLNSFSKKDRNYFLQAGSVLPNTPTSWNQTYDVGLFEARAISSKDLYKGQTYIQWKVARDIDLLSRLCSTEKKSIYIQPVDGFPDFLANFSIQIYDKSCSLFSFVRQFVNIFFQGFNVSLLPAIDIKKHGWNISRRIHQVTGKEQLLVSDFYPLMQKTLPRDGQCIMGLTWYDLYPEKDLNFVLGESSFKHRSGIFSFGRFEPSSFNNRDEAPDIDDIDAALLWKLLKVN